MPIGSTALAIFAASFLYLTWGAVTWGLVDPPRNLGGALVFDVATRVFLPAAALACLYKMGNVRPSDYWLTSPLLRRGRLEALSVALLVTLLMFTYVLVEQIATWGPSSVEIAAGVEKHRDLSPHSALALITYLSASASFSEEVFFRALPLLIFAPLRPFWLGMIGFFAVSTVLFGLMHLPYGASHVLATGYFGMIAGCALLWTQNLWYPLVGHFVVNAVVMWWRFEQLAVLPI